MFKNSSISIFGILYEYFCFDVILPESSMVLKTITNNNNGERMDGEIAYDKDTSDSESQAITSSLVVVHERKKVKHTHFNHQLVLIYHRKQLICEFDFLISTDGSSKCSFA